MSFKTPLGLLPLSGVFLLSDRFFKWQALYEWTRPVLWGEKFGWEPFLNKGIAFGIILPPYFIFIFTASIILSVLYLFYMHFKEAPANYRTRALAGLMLVVTGAVSNLADRLIYGYTVDYLRIYSSVLNLADFFIIFGFVLYFASLKHLE